MAALIAIQTTPTPCGLTEDQIARRIQAAHGYADLGLFKEGLEEIAELPVNRCTLQALKLVLLRLAASAAHYLESERAAGRYPAASPQG